MENNENNPPPPHQVDEQFDEVAPRHNRILRDYARPDHFEGESSVRRPPIAANNFEIRTYLIQTIQNSCQFTGDVSEDPHSHLIDFLELAETCRYNGVTTDAIRLRLFPFSLKGEAKTWLRGLPRGSITTWDQMTQKFLNKYFSLAKTIKMKQEINNFMQTDTESIYQAWERLNSMLRKCPHHGIQDSDILYIFYHGLKPSARNVIDAASGGSIMGKTTAEATQLLNEISENAIQWPSDRMIIKKAAGVNQVEALNSLTQQIATLTQKVEAIQVNAHSPSKLENCDVCGGNHPNHECQASTQNEEQQVQAPPGFQNQNRGQQSFQQYEQQPQRTHQPGLEDLIYKYIKTADEKMESQNSAIKNLEIQVSQLATLMSGQIQGTLPSNTEKNPREHLKAIALRSGKALDDPYADRQGTPREVEQVNESENKNEPKLPSEQKEKGGRK
ncbi:uncharacterized protein LOC132612180 [Lycium barbarum]|uniref:uncharacterized protein LOC132612180 n=1 Tax=Lycium barbarum TaxID=112863 RepID=UPI00293E2A42|nr:uncharacterized protein LOC132612180 [Lycium barbarum]